MENNTNTFFYVLVVIFGLVIISYIVYNVIALKQIDKFAYKGDKTRAVMAVYIAVALAIISLALIYIISIF